MWLRFPSLEGRTRSRSLNLQEDSWNWESDNVYFFTVASPFHDFYGCPERRHILFWLSFSTQIFSMLTLLRPGYQFSVSWFYYWFLCSVFFLGGGFSNRRTYTHRCVIVFVFIYACVFLCACAKREREREGGGREREKEWNNFIYIHREEESWDRRSP